MKTGLVLGKFYPPHKGHIYLIERAKYNVDYLLVVMGSSFNEEIGPEQRLVWLKCLVPHNTEVISVPDDNPPGVTPDQELYWTMWRDNLLKHMPFKPQNLFASEEYGIKLSKIMGMNFTMVDQERSHVPVSGTLIRSNPKKYEQFIPDIVKPYYGL